MLTVQLREGLALRPHLTQSSQGRATGPGGMQGPSGAPGHKASVSLISLILGNSLP